ncbi:anthranilate phosphoribosyltransferase [Marine Group I thaumarchaeote]|uniref:Anthranilate phosphoribosyltransferase n=1 Tax=Marine Group I thaumarchaeote TaxID=2511932 RepID=A0A7K4MUV0_9ARCH|nr:MAG: anthranilate phosphoribosyltransferase [Nitrosopumilus sp. YT1]NMI82592.1 anthranilate phosphoribosyltransferase [Candidatus Nitrosopumilus sp. MTA1]NWJ20638.1 anthranilate phosphoribosyltransferase [Marine Group I thaumarchaeote]NWJ57218.1 anthranilate phosphoribosyltransferase [Marine Group I thaumarchaeote]NWJ83738.1 anthranilate phosphoribosyltransferase [Marine Group I thaumarchaeote]
MISNLIQKLQEKTDLTYDEMNNIMADILSGNTNIQENADFLSNLEEKGETDDELLGMLDKMQELSLKIEPKNTGTIIDMCGTGGDKLQTFNISTTASFVVAAAGGVVAKHGNRSTSGVSGSADIFEYFGYDLSQEPSKIVQILEKHKICFMFAQKFHPAMKYVGPARKQLGKRTAFNLLGPLSNPAGVKNQLVGVFSNEYLDRLPAILKRRGAENIMTVRSDDGMDEFSTSATNRVCILRDDKVLMNVIDPEVVGLHKSSLKDIQIETREDAIKSFVGVLNNTANQAMIETTALNAAGGLIVANIANNFEEGVELAMNTISNGKAFKTLENFVVDTGDISKLKEII